MHSLLILLAFSSSSKQTPGFLAGPQLGPAPTTAPPLFTARGGTGHPYGYQEEDWPLPPAARVPAATRLLSTPSGVHSGLAAPDSQLVSSLSTHPCFPG